MLPPLNFMAKFKNNNKLFFHFEWHALKLNIGFRALHQFGFAVYFFARGESIKWSRTSSKNWSNICPINMTNSPMATSTIFISTKITNNYEISDVELLFVIVMCCFASNKMFFFLPGKTIFSSRIIYSSNWE